MSYRLPTCEIEELRIVINARYADSFAESLRITRRLIEITSGNRSSFGIMCVGQDRYFGRMPLPGAIDGPSIDSPKTIDELGANLELAEQKAVVAEFRKIQNGKIRDAMSAISEQLGNKPVYFQYYGHGMIAVLQRDGEWAPCLLRFQDAQTIAEERVCSKINKASKETYTVLKNALAEMILRDTEEKERLRREETVGSGEDEDVPVNTETEDSGEMPDDGRWADTPDAPPPDPAYDVEWDDVDHVSF